MKGRAGTSARVGDSTERTNEGLAASKQHDPIGLRVYTLLFFLRVVVFSCYSRSAVAIVAGRGVAINLGKDGADRHYGCGNERQVHGRFQQFIECVVGFGFRRLVVVVVFIVVVFVVIVVVVLCVIGEESWCCAATAISSAESSSNRTIGRRR